MPGQREKKCQNDSYDLDLEINQTRLDEAVVEKLGGKNIIDKLVNMLELSKISTCHLKYVVEHFLNIQKTKQN